MLKAYMEAKKNSYYWLDMRFHSGKLDVLLCYGVSKTYITHFFGPCMYFFIISGAIFSCIIIICT
jgi:hypothetical protein